MSFSRDWSFGDSAVAVSGNKAISLAYKPGDLGYRVIAQPAYVYNGPQDTNHSTFQYWGIPILSASALIAKRAPPAGYPIKNPTGQEPLDAYLPAKARAVRYGGVSDSHWNALSWRRYMLWGTGGTYGKELPSAKTTPSGTGAYTPTAKSGTNAVFLGWAPGTPGGGKIYNGSIDTLVGMTAKEQSFIDADNMRSDNWVDKNAWVPAVVMGIAGGAAAIAAGGAAAGAGTASSISSGASGSAGVVGAGVATTTATTVVTTAPSLATMAGAGSMVGGFGAGIGGAAAVVPASLTGIVGAGTVASVAGGVASAGGGAAASVGGGTVATAAGGTGLVGTAVKVAASLAPKAIALLTQKTPTTAVAATPVTQVAQPTGILASLGLGGVSDTTLLIAGGIILIALVARR